MHTGLSAAKKNVFLFCILALFIPACADYQLHYSEQHREWKEKIPPADLELEHTLYLIGDAGYPPDDTSAPTLRMLAEKLRTAGKNTTVVFLGDNLAPNGMAPPEEKEERARDEARVQDLLDPLEGFPGQVFFVPGNTDWSSYGIEGLERARSFIEKQLDRKNLWYPKPGCGDPKEIELGDNLVLLLVDTQWWLANWRKYPFLNEGCTIKGRSAFKLAFEEALKGNREKNIVVAMHHPLYSNGPHGGQFTFRRHLFPLTDANPRLWIPIPLLGSLYPFFRSTMGIRQDLIHPDYQELKSFMIDAARKNGSFIFAGGHDHIQQYLEQDDQYFIVSGGGSRRDAAKLANNAAFSYGGRGFAQLDFYKDGSAWVQFWSPGENGGEVVYRQKVKGALPALAETREMPDFSLYESDKDSIKTRISQSDFSRGGMGRWFWGQHYRDAYSAVINAPVLDLKSFQGGVEAVDQGGGYQTNSLRLETDDGRQYVMRSIDKDPTRLLPHPLNQSRLLLRIIRDSYTGAHPMAAVPLPHLQDAVNLYHTNPKLFYVPHQPALGKYNRQFGNGLYLVEERPDDDVWQEHAPFGYPKDLLSTENVLENIHEKHDHLIDQRWALRARLFDVTIGDWDRHDDQWRWAEIDSAGKTYYRPVPRDRDQAMSKYDGLVYMLARATTPAARPLRNFKPYHHRIWWSNFGARYFDSAFLNEMNWEDWEQEARFIQANLSDEVIEEAFREAWPEAVFRLDGPQTVQILKERRDNLLLMARRLYEHRARKVDVVGTEKRDLFEVVRQEKFKTLVKVYDTNKDGEQEDLLFERVFDSRITREIRLFGLAGGDIFSVVGEVEKSSRIRIVGGPDKDVFVDQSNVGGGGRKTIIHDIRSEESVTQIGEETTLLLTNNPEYNIYNRRAFDYESDYWTFLPSIAINPDDGFLMGAAATFVQYGYHQSPYAGKHFIAGRYAFGSEGFELLHRSEFIDVIGDWEILVDSKFRSPLYTRNFYGFGNETSNPEDSLGPDFNRVRMREFSLAPAITLIHNQASRVSFGPTFEAIEVERTPGRFLDGYVDREELPFSENFFDGQHFFGLRFVYDYANLNHVTFPTRGVKIHLDAGWKMRFNRQGSNFPYLEASVAGVQPIDFHRRLTFASRIGGRHIFNNQFEFYQGAALGGSGDLINFRGFRRDRFIGRSSVYQNLDLRYRMMESANRFIPFSIGIFAGFDHGRVWIDGEDSNTWHYSYGGGLFLSPFDLLSAQLSLFRGDTGEWRFALMGSFSF